MLKKITALLLCMLMLTTSAFASVFPPTSDDPIKNEWTAPASGDPLTLLGDFVLNVNDTLYWGLNPMNSCELEGFGYYDGLKDTGLDVVCGEPIDFITTPSCAQKGEDKEWVYDGLIIYTNPVGVTDLWFEAYITGGDWSTSRGISIGSTKDDVLAAYGDSYISDDNNYLMYNISGDPTDYGSPNISFEYEDDGTVIGIDIYYPTNVL